MLRAARREAETLPGTAQGSASPLSGRDPGGACVSLVPCRGVGVQSLEHGRLVRETGKGRDPGLRGGEGRRRQAWQKGRLCVRVAWEPGCLRGL